MTMKKKVLTTLSVVLILGMASLGILAYQAEQTKTDTNVMTLGSVHIAQIEQERDDNGNLTDFTPNKALFPAVYDKITWDANTVDVNGADCKVFNANMKNVVDKIISVENTGKSEAYIRTVVAFEEPEGFDPQLIHFAANIAYEEIGYIKIAGQRYYAVAFTYEDALAAGDKSEPSLMQVFLGKEATNEDVEKLGDTYVIKALSQAVQTAGFKTAEEALNAGFGEANVPNAEEWFIEKVYVTDDFESDEPGAYAYYAELGTETTFDVNIISAGGGINVRDTAVFESGSIVTNNGTSSPRHMFYVAGPDGHLTINGGEFTFNPTNLTRKGSYLCAHVDATIIVNGGTFHKPSTRTAPIQALDGGTVTIYGGSFAFDPSAFVADGYQAVKGTDGYWTVSKQ